jgi:hypothetical protein
MRIQEDVNSFLELRNKDKHMRWYDKLLLLNGNVFPFKTHLKPHARSKTNFTRLKVLVQADNVLALD